MATDEKFIPTLQHRQSLAGAPDPFPTLTLYGKMIDKVSLTPSPDGITHPSGVKDDLHAGLIVGYSYAGNCFKLDPPVQVLLPHPDGPADGCEWDSNEFVVWKNIPKDWETLHIQTQAKPLMSALLTAHASLPDPYTIFQQWLGTTSILDETATLKSLWANYNHEAGGHALDFNKFGVPRLINLIKSAYPTFNADTTTVAGWTLGAAIKTLDELSG